MVNLLGKIGSAISNKAMSLGVAASLLAGAAGYVAKSANADTIPIIEAPTQLRTDQDYCIKLKLSSSDQNLKAFDWKFFSTGGISVNSSGYGKPTSQDIFANHNMVNDINKIYAPNSTLISDRSTVVTPIPDPVIAAYSGYVAQYNFHVTGSVGSTGQFTEKTMTAWFPIGSQTFSEIDSYYTIVDVPATSLTDIVNGKIITGGHATLGATVNNSVANADTLNVNVARNVTSGSVTLGALSPGSSGVISSLGSQVYSFDATSTNIGANTINFGTVGTGLDATNTTNANKNVDLTLTVLDHASPTLSVTSGNNFNLLKGANATVNLTLANVGASRADLDVNSSNMSGSLGDKLLGSTSGNYSGAYTFAIPTNTIGVYSGAASINVGDDHLLSGANSAINVTQPISGNVGNATAGGAPLYARGATDLTGLESMVTTGGLSGSGFNSDAKILAGANSSAGDVSMAWRARNSNELLKSEAGSTNTTFYGLTSDVVDVEGTGSSVYVLEMPYDRALLNLGVNGRTEAGLANAGQIQLLEFENSKWVSAGNKDLFMGNNTLDPVTGYSSFYDPAGDGLSNDIGRWGVDTTNNEVWAVVNSSGNFAVTPEPATLGFLALGGAAMAGAALNRKKRSKLESVL